MHLTPEELLDLAEGTRASSSAPHLVTCATCRQQLDDLRGVLASIDVPVPEPSPLFWDHLSAQVRERVAAEGAPASTWFGLGRWAWGLTAAMSAAVVVFAVSLTLRNAPSTTPSMPGVAEDVASDVGFVATGDDPSFSLLGDLAGGLDWDTATEAGIGVDIGSADIAVTGLNDDERSELHRLLREAMSNSGA